MELTINNVTQTQIKTSNKGYHFERKKIFQSFKINLKKRGYSKLSVVLINICIIRIQENDLKF